MIAPHGEKFLGKIVVRVVYHFSDKKVSCCVAIFFLMLRISNNFFLTVSFVKAYIYPRFLYSRFSIIFACLSLYNIISSKFLDASTLDIFFSFLPTSRSTRTSRIKRTYQNNFYSFGKL